MTEPIFLLALGEAFGEVNDVVPSWEALWRLIAAAALGAIVGVEREVNDQPAGLRTHLTVAMGAAVFGIISTLGFSEFVVGQRDVNVQFDVTRVASQVVVGIGFLGAGVIFRSGSKIRNLTTAASLWATAAVGLAAGVGDIGIAIVAAAALLLALVLLRIPKDAIRTRLTRRQVHVAIRVAGVDAAHSVLEQVRAIGGIQVVKVGWGKIDGDPVLDLTIQAEPRTRPEDQLEPVVTRSDVVSVHTDVFLEAELREED